MTTRVFYDSGALFIEQREPYPPRSLRATIAGTRIQVASLSGMMVTNLEFGEYATKAGATFATAALAKAYLDGEFAQGPAGNNTLLGTVTVGETAAVAILAGVRKVTVTAAGVVPGGNYLLFAIGATPAGYALADVVATAANTLQVTVTVPAIVLGASYSIPCRLVRINT